MTVSPRARSLELFFIDGRPDGMLTAEVFNWTGHVLMTPRTQLADALKRSETGYTGVYLLFGENDGEPLAYIGEAEDVSDRIRNHDSRKDWWDTAVIITSAANNLNKAHVRYLESRLIEEARAIGQIKLENGNSPSRPGLSEAAQANMEAFLDYIMMVLPALRIDSFLRNTRPAPRPTERNELMAATPIFELKTPSHGITATARLENGEFVVLVGSLARTKWVGQSSGHTGYKQLHDDLVRTGVIQDHDGKLRIFTENYAFKSPSAAAAVVNGRPANGTLEWKVQGQNKTYKEWEAGQLDRNSGEVAG